MIKAIVTSIIYCLIPLHIFAQDYFTVDRHRNVEIKEAYDGGYLLLSDESSGSEPSHITKLSLKGDVLWDIALEPDYGALLTTSMEIDGENNIYVAGNTGRHDNTFGDSFTLKLSPCGELVWIHFYGYRDYWDIVTDMNISDQDYIHTIYVQNYGVQNQNTGVIENAGKLRQAKLNLNGDTIWSRVWPVITGVDEHYKIIATNDGGSLISMESYFSYQGSPNYIRPTLYKIDENGENQWIKRIGVEEGMLGSINASGIELNNGNFISIVTKIDLTIDDLFTPYFAKLDSNGELLNFFPLIEDETTSYDGAYYSLIKQNENELIMGLVAQPLDDNITFYFALYKLDNNGNILQTYINENESIAPRGIDICENGDILAAFQASGFDEPNNTHIYRFDSETLAPITVPEQDDTNYDTLCPDGIAMSEYSFPTAEDLGQSQLTITKGMAFQIFPNPVKDQLSLQWTKPLEQTNENWLVECYDVFGKLIYQSTIKPSSGSLKLNTSAWKKGVYFLSIKHNNELIYQNKIVK